MRDCIINIKPKIVGTFSDSDDEIQVSDLFIDDDKNLILNLKINETVLKVNNSIKYHKLTSQFPVKILESDCTWFPNF